MPIQLVGLKQATCTMRVFITLEEKGVDDYVLQEINMMDGELKKPPFIEKNPFGQIPVLEDGDLTIFESRAICRYLENKYKDQGTKLMPEPSNIKAMALFEQWASAELSHFDSAISSIYYQNIVRKYLGLDPVPEILDESLKDLSTKLDVYNSILGKQRYMAGNEFSLVDIFFVPYVNRMFKMEIGDMVMDRPHLKMWWETVSSRPSVKKWST
ncbi:glutathione S-transferase [Bisporella sp. PMI_857]|nr:glutathione S-transferase [Bisporella sp. PMI_857]